MCNRYNLEEKKRLEDVWGSYSETFFYVAEIKNSVFGFQEIGGGDLAEIKDFEHEVVLNCQKTKSKKGNDYYNVAVDKQQDSVAEAALLLSYKTDKCYFVRIPKSYERDMYLLTPGLTGCSIHIVNEENDWLILHDARKVPSSEVATNRREGIFVNHDKVLSFEYTNRGYRFYVKPSGSEPAIALMKEGTDSVCCAGVMFHYDTDNGWMMKAHSCTIENIEIGSVEIALNNIWK